MPAYFAARLRTKEDLPATPIFFIDPIEHELGTISKAPTFYYAPVDYSYYHIGQVDAPDIACVPLIDLGAVDDFGYSNKQAAESRQSVMVERLLERNASLKMQLVDWSKLEFDDDFLDLVKRLPKRGAGGFANLVDDHLNTALVETIFRAYLLGLRA